MIRRITLCFAVVAILWPTFASAHIATYPTRVKRTSVAIQGDQVTKLGGVVRSPRARCVRDRQVVVYFAKQRFGATTTDTEGRWQIDGEGPVDRRYRYTVYPKRIGKLPHRHTCATARFDEVIEG